MTVAITNLYEQVFKIIFFIFIVNKHDRQTHKYVELRNTFDAFVKCIYLYFKKFMYFSLFKTF